ALVEDGIDLPFLHEGVEVYGMLAGKGQTLEVFVGQDDVTTLGVLIRPGRLIPGHFNLVLGAPPALLELGAAGSVDQIEPDIAAGRCAKQFYRDGDHPEAYGAAPDRLRHCASLFSTAEQTLSTVYQHNLFINNDL